MKLKKLPIHKFIFEKSINYNRISLSLILDNLSYTSINKNVEILGYQNSDAVGRYKKYFPYVILFEFKDAPGEEYWFHSSEHFFLLSGFTK